MKYEIKEIDPERTIKKYKIDKNGIKIIFLKGKCSYYRNNDIVKSQINNVMLEQAKAYLNDKKTYTYLEKSKKKLLDCIILTITMLIGILIFLIISSVSLVIIMTNVVLTIILLGIVLITKNNHKQIVTKVNKDKLKYQLYVDNNEKLEEYYNNLSNKKIIDKNNTSLINNLDKIKLQHLRNMLVQMEKKEEEFGYQKKIGGLK